MNIPFLNTFLLLILLVSIVGFISYFLKRYNPVTNNSILKKRQVKIINRISLTPKSHLFIISYEGKTKLLGVSDNNITVLDNLSDLTEEELSMVENQKLMTDSFKNILKK